MDSYLLTHSLLSSWLYLMKENPYEDLTTEFDPMEEFLATLRREPTTQNEAMQNGVDFENLVTDITKGYGDPGNRWYEAAEKIARIVQNGSLQHKASKQVSVSGMDLVLYGRLDALKSGHIYDIKFSKGYDRGKYVSSTQHPVYLELVPEAQDFTYLVSNGSEVWQETYRREETPSIYPIIADFLQWLESTDLMSLYRAKWKSL